MCIITISGKINLRQVHVHVCSPWFSKVLQTEMYMYMYMVYLESLKYGTLTVVMILTVHITMYIHNCLDSTGTLLLHFHIGFR